MPPGTPCGPRRSLEQVVAGYDRIARVYRGLIEPLFMITPHARRRAVAALNLRPGDVVLELGAGSARNLPYLLEAVGAQGKVIAVDASAGMLAQAHRLVTRRGWRNVQLIQQDAAAVEIEQDVDAVLFGLSYSVMQEAGAALARGWERLRPRGSVVVLDAGLPDNLLGRVLAPLARALVRLAPGDPYARPWEELAGYGAVRTERFLLGLYYVCTVMKDPSAAEAHRR
jgi:ubiquinone/menaquinone biosynthesis C-methylase UbiE